MINALRVMAPNGKENPWNAILDSLVSLLTRGRRSQTGWYSTSSCPTDTTT